MHISCFFSGLATIIINTFVMYFHFMKGPLESLFNGICFLFKKNSEGPVSSVKKWDMNYGEKGSLMWQEKLKGKTL